MNRSLPEYFERLAAWKEEVQSDPTKANDANNHELFVNTMVWIAVNSISLSQAQQTFLSDVQRFVPENKLENICLIAAQSGHQEIAEILCLCNSQKIFDTLLFSSSFNHQKDIFAMVVDRGDPTQQNSRILSAQYDSIREFCCVGSPRSTTMAKMSF